MRGEENQRWLGRDGLSTEQQRALAMIECWGWHATSFQLMEPGYQYWFAPGEEGVIGYVRWGRYWVVAGPPIALEGAMVRVVQAFLREVRGASGRVLFVSVERAWLDEMSARGESFDRLPLGEQPEWSLASYTLQTPRRKTLRSQVRRAAKKGVVVEEFYPASGPGEARDTVEALATSWLSARKMGPLHFLVAMEPYHLPGLRRYFMARANGLPVGVLIAIPVYNREGWFIEDVLRVQGAPNGAVESLIHHALAAFQEDESSYATLGLSPLAGVMGEPSSAPHPLIRRAQHFVFVRLNWVYQFAGLHAFKRRFVPDEWTPQYLATCGRKLGLWDLFVLVNVLTGPGFFSFVGDGLRRRWQGLSPGMRFGCVFVVVLALVLAWILFGGSLGPLLACSFQGVLGAEYTT